MDHFEELRDRNKLSISYEIVSDDGLLLLKINQNGQSIDNIEALNQAVEEEKSKFESIVIKVHFEDKMENHRELIKKVEESIRKITSDCKQVRYLSIQIID